MSEKRLSDEAVNQLIAELQDHESETFYVTYRERTEDLAKEIEAALRNCEWVNESEVVIDEAPLLNGPGIRVESTTEQPTANVLAFLEWLQGQGLIVGYTCNPRINALAIHVETAPAPEDIDLSMGGREIFFKPSSRPLLPSHDGWVLYDVYVDGEYAGLVANTRLEADLGEETWRPLENKEGRTLPAQGLNEQEAACVFY